MPSAKIKNRRRKKRSTGIGEMLIDAMITGTIKTIAGSFNAQYFHTDNPPEQPEQTVDIPYEDVTEQKQIQNGK